MFPILSEFLGLVVVPGLVDGLQEVLDVVGEDEGADVTQELRDRLETGVDCYYF
jgi:hypothetical protein